MTAPILSVLLEQARRPRRESTGLEGLQYEEVSRKGTLFLQGNTATREDCSPIAGAEAWEDVVVRLQPLIADWTDTARAVLALRLQGYTVREIKAELRVGGDLVCAVIRKVRTFLA